MIAPLNPLQNTIGWGWVVKGDPGPLDGVGGGGEDGKEIFSK